VLVEIKTLREASEVLFELSLKITQNMKVKRTPQEKKRLSYENDCRNQYGENDKSSRKAIHFRKHWVNKTYRSQVRQATNLIKGTEENTDNDQTNQIDNVKRKSWKKYPDTPLAVGLFAEGKIVKKVANYKLYHKYRPR
jgi:hypothetical protein